jgi:hypothetical protein
VVSPKEILALLIEGMIFSEKGRGAPFLRKNHPWILQPRNSYPLFVSPSG